MNLWKKMLFSFSSTPLGAGLMKVSSVHIDPMIFKATGGRFTSIGPTVIPHLLLTTTGRKSGEKREAQLVYTDIDGAIYVVASNFGGKSHPAWSYNLDADPNATMQIHKDAVAVNARLLNEEEKESVWDRLVDNIPNYKSYKQRTNRDLKVYCLMPCE